MLKKTDEMKKLLMILFFVIIALQSCKKNISENDDIKLTEKAKLDSLFEIARIQNLDQNIEGQIKAYSDIIEFQNYNIDALGNRATLYSKNGEYERAVVDFTNLIELNEKNNVFNSVDYLHRAICKFELKDYTGCLNDLDITAKYNQDLQDLYVYRAYSHLNLGNKEEACVNFSKAGEKGFSEAYEEIKKNCN